VRSTKEGQQKWISTEDGRQKWDQNTGRTIKMRSEKRKDDKNGIRKEEGTTKMGSEQRKDNKSGIRGEEGKQK
jgi:hypothetical protein